MYGQYCERVNTEQEMSEHLNCAGIYAMYVLFWRLLPSNVVPDARLHRPCVSKNDLEYYFTQ